MKAAYLLKHNVDALLKARGQTRHDLAFWCRRTDAWLSKILGKDDRNLPLKYLDRIADFFGIATYQLFQPGISPLTERRSGKERRSGTDRRVSGRQREIVTTPVRGLTLTPDDEAILAKLHELDYEQYQHVKSWIDVARFGSRTPRSTGLRAVPPPGDEPPPKRAPRTRAPRSRKPRADDRRIES